MALFGLIGGKKTISVHYEISEKIVDDLVKKVELLHKRLFDLTGRVSPFSNKPMMIADVCKNNLVKLYKATQKLKKVEKEKKVLEALKEILHAYTSWVLYNIGRWSVTKGKYIIGGAVNASPSKEHWTWIVKETTEIGVLIEKIYLAVSEAMMKEYKKSQRLAFEKKYIDEAIDDLKNFKYCMPQSRK